MVFPDLSFFKLKIPYIGTIDSRKRLTPDQCDHLYIDEKVENSWGRGKEEGEEEEDEVI